MAPMNGFEGIIRGNDCTLLTIVAVPRESLWIVLIPVAISFVCIPFWHVDVRLIALIQLKVLNVVLRLFQ